MSPMSADGARLPRFWIPLMVVGALTAAFGVWLVLSTNAKVATMALLLAAALLLAGLGELVVAAGRPRPWVGYLLGGLFVVASVVTLLRPDRSLTFLAVFVGISFIVTGVLQLAVAVFDRQDVEHWVALALTGAAGVVAGVLAIAWPDITVWVLGLVMGVRILVLGVVEMLVANQLRQLTA